MFAGPFLAFVRLLMRLLYRIEVSGLEKVPASGAVILACNHLSNIDPPALMSFVKKARPDACIIAKKELFAVPVLGLVIRSLGAFPVDRRREGGDLGAMRAALGVLRAGRLLAIFPEGTRAKGKKLEPKAGVAMLAHRAGAPVLTARVFNSENAAKLGKIKVKFGSLMTFAPSGEDPKKDYLEFSRAVMDGIFAITED